MSEFPKDLYICKTSLALTETSPSLCTTPWKIQDLDTGEYLRVYFRVSRGVAGGILGWVGREYEGVMVGTNGYTSRSKGGY